MGHSVIDRGERSILENTSWTLRQVDWHHVHGHGDLIACSLRLNSMLPPRSCRVYVHVPESHQGQVIESSKVDIQRMFGGDRQFSFAPGEIAVEGRGRGRATVTLSGLRHSNGSVVGPIRMTITVPDNLAGEFEQAERFCADECS